MAYYQRRDSVTEIVSGHGHSSWPLLGEAQGCVNACAGGISSYTSTEYTPPATHDFQEGFIVLSGHGRAKVGTEEFPLDPETAFLVPQGVNHQLKSISPDTPLLLFWFHAKA